MSDVKASIEYNISLNNSEYRLTQKQYNLLLNIHEYSSLTRAVKNMDITYRTAINYIKKIESALDIKVINSTRGGKKGSKTAYLTTDALSIVLECKKLDATFKLHRNVNEITTSVVAIDELKGIMTIKNNEFKINTRLNKGYEVGDSVLALISYDNIFLMLKPHKSSIRNILKGQIVEMKLEGDIIRVKVDVGGVYLYSDITLSAEKELNLDIGCEIYLGFKAMSVATLKVD